MRHLLRYRFRRTRKALCGGLPSGDHLSVPVSLKSALELYELKALRVAVTRNAVGGQVYGRSPHIRIILQRLSFLVTWVSMDLLGPEPSLYTCFCIFIYTY